MKSSIVDIHVVFHNQTDAAVLVAENEEEPPVWIPKSQCEFDPYDPERGDTILLTAPEATLAEKRLL